MGISGVCVCLSSVIMKEEVLSALCTPALVVDVDKVKRNVQRMIERFEKLGVQLRPHMKTHKTLYEYTHTQPHAFVQHNETGQSHGKDAEKVCICV